MIREILQDLAALKQGVGELRQFGWTMASAFGLLSAFLYWRHPSATTTVPAVLAAVLFALGAALRPPVLAGIRTLWMGLAFVMGYFMSRVILGVCYYLVITPIGLITRAAGKDLLNTKIDKDAPTHWIIRSPAAEDPARWERQF